MGNCLKTQLKENVNNDSLLKMNEIRILAKEVSGASAPAFTYSNGTSNPLIVEYTDGTSFPNQGVLPLNGKTLSIISKYDLNELKWDSENIVVLGDPGALITYTDLMIDLRVWFENTITLDAFAKKPVKNVLKQARISAASGNIANFDGFTSLETLSFNDLSSVTGDVTSLGSCISLNQLVINYTNIEGSLEELAEAQIANGRTSGTMFVAKSPLVTVGGSTEGQNFNITFGPSLPNGYSISAA